MNAIDDTLHKLRMAAEFGHATPEEKRRFMDAYHSVEWYVSTGRASLDFEKALARADPQKLLSHILNGEDQSVDGQIARVKSYVQRYCRRKREASR